MIKKPFLFIFLMACLLLCICACGETIFLDEIKMSLDVPEGFAAFYPGHIDEEEAQDYLFTSATEEESYLRENGILMQMITLDPYCDITVALVDAYELDDWNELDYSGFLRLVPLFKAGMQDSITIRQAKAYFTNQARYILIDGTVQAEEYSFDSRQYMKYQDKKVIMINCRVYPGITIQTEALIQHVIDSIWYDGVEPFVGQAIFTGEKGDKNVISLDGFSLSLPNGWQEDTSFQTGYNKFINGTMLLLLSSQDIWSYLSPSEKKILKREDCSLLPYLRGMDIEEYRAFVDEKEKSFEATSTSTMKGLLSETGVASEIFPAELLSLPITCTLEFDGGILSDFPGEPFILYAGKSVASGENDAAIVRIVQDAYLYHNFHNGCSNTIQVYGHLSEKAKEEISALINTIEYR